MNWQAIEASITSATGEEFRVLSSSSVGGGSVNSAYLVQNDVNKYFVKLNVRQYSEMFVAEAEGLNELIKPDCIKVPKPISWGESSDHAFIVMDYVPTSRGDKNSAVVFGEQLARLHQFQNEEFGWHRNNTIGSTKQINKKSKDWIDFYREHRLQYQISLAARAGAGRELESLGEKLCSHLNAFFQTYQPKPSLLHGDLWSGNYAFDGQSNPVIFDPAVYYGDREADIAMTELFGGFSNSFYTAYDNVFALDEGYTTRKTLYNLYHVLNHFNLFGGGYYSQSIDMMKKLLAEI